MGRALVLPPYTPRAMAGAQGNGSQKESTPPAVQGHVLPADNKFVSMHCELMVFQKIVRMHVLFNV